MQMSTDKVRNNIQRKEKEGRKKYTKCGNRNERRGEKLKAAEEEAEYVVLKM